MEIIAKTCSTNCYGIRGYHGSCCRIEERNWIMGPVPDAAEVLQKLQKRNPDLVWEDCFVDYEEGSAAYPEREVWQHRENYPAMRINPTTTACVFYNESVRGCSIYAERSVTCREFICGFLKSEMISQSALLQL